MVMNIILYLIHIKKLVNEIGIQFGKEIKNMAFFCKRKVSKSKRKTIGCKGCKYYEKVFWNNHWQWRCTC